MVFQFHNALITGWNLDDENWWLSLGGTAKVNYVVIALEVCPNTERMHLQCYFEFAKKISLAGIVKLLGTEKIKVINRLGTQAEAREYCMGIDKGKKKEGVIRFTERGTPKAQGSRADLDGVRVMAAEQGMRAVSRSCNMQQIRVAEKFLSYNEVGRDWKPEVIWIWGSSGSGKSRKAHEIMAEREIEFYRKATGSKWWDGYDGHEGVIIDDFRASWWPFTYMLDLLDRYASQVEVKGGSRQFKPRVIIITSIYSQKCTYENIGEDHVQLDRRIDHSICMDLASSQKSGGNTVTPSAVETVDGCYECLRVSDDIV